MKFLTYYINKTLKEINKFLFHKKYLTNYIFCITIYNLVHFIFVDFIAVKTGLFLLFRRAYMKKKDQKSVILFCVHLKCVNIQFSKEKSLIFYY